MHATNETAGPPAGFHLNKHSNGIRATHAYLTLQRVVQCPGLGQVAGRFRLLGLRGTQARLQAADF